MPSTTRAKVSVPLLVTGTVVVLCVIVAVIYFGRGPKSSADTATPASSEAKAYLKYLQLSDVSMKATENFMKQQVVEVEGKITNHGPRPIDSVSVYCLFSGVEGREVYRERVPVVQVKGEPLKPGETRKFRLPFDSLPDTWNQALPRMVIAQITFAR
jgi:hypothetical protein